MGTKGTRIGVILSILLGLYWALAGMGDWPTWIGVVASIAVGVYWAFGRALVDQKQDTSG